MTPLTDDPAVIEHRLLDLANTTDLAITVSTLAYYAPCSQADAEHVLDLLVADDRLRVEADDVGNVVYAFAHRPRVACSPLRPVVVVRHDVLPAHSRHPSPALAGVLSLVIPGSGQLYAGQMVSPIVWLAAVAIGYLIATALGIVLHVACVAAAVGAVTRRHADA